MILHHIIAAYSRQVHHLHILGQNLHLESQHLSFEASLGIDRYELRKLNADKGRIIMDFSNSSRVMRIVDDCTKENFPAENATRS